MKGLEVLYLVLLQYHGFFGIGEYFISPFFLSEKVIPNKLNFIHKYLYNASHLFWLPVFSTIIILTVLQFINNGAFWLDLKFKKWRIEQRNEIEMKQLLTLEQSIKLREQISKQEDRFDKLLENKDLEIKQLNAIIDDYKKSITPAIKKEKETSEVNQTELKEILKRIKSNQVDSIGYEELTRYIQGGYKPNSNDRIGTKLIALLESHDIIKNIGNGIYQFTEKGKSFQRLMTE